MGINDMAISKLGRITENNSPYELPAIIHNTIIYM